MLVPSFVGPSQFVDPPLGGLNPQWKTKWVLFLCCFNFIILHRMSSRKLFGLLISNEHHYHAYFKSLVVQYLAISIVTSYAEKAYDQANAIIIKLEISIVLFLSIYVHNHI